MVIKCQSPNSMSAVKKFIIKNFILSTNILNRCLEMIILKRLVPQPKDIFIKKDINLHMHGWVLMVGIKSLF